MAILVLQQYLPFTVLKLSKRSWRSQVFPFVAPVLTVYGIETGRVRFLPGGPIRLVATVLTVYGIETILLSRLLVG